MKKLEIHKLDDFISQMPKNLPGIMHKARWLYWQLGERSFYDRKYNNLMFDEQEQYSIYSYKPYSVPNIIICQTLIKQYKQLLDMSHIRNKIIIDESGHYSLVFYDGEGRKISTDLTHDLKNIQFGCSTSYFGKEEVSEEELRTIDIYLGYITSSKGYSNDYWDLLRRKLDESTLSNKTKLSIILKSLKEFGDLTKLGESELFSLYEKFVKYCVNKKFAVCFYSIITNNNIEEFWLELREKDRAVKYKLNRHTLEFEENEVRVLEGIEK